MADTPEHPHAPTDAQFSQFMNGSADKAQFRDLIQVTLFAMLDDGDGYEEEPPPRYGFPVHDDCGSGRRQSL